MIYLTILRCLPPSHNPAHTRDGRELGPHPAPHLQVLLLAAARARIAHALPERPAPWLERVRAHALADDAIRRLVRLRLVTFDAALFLPGRETVLFALRECAELRTVVFRECAWPPMRGLEGLMGALPWRTVRTVRVVGWADVWPPYYEVLSRVKVVNNIMGDMPRLEVRPILSRYGAS